LYPGFKPQALYLLESKIDRNEALELFRMKFDREEA
jgi:hypothetical protein